MPEQTPQDERIADLEAELARARREQYAGLRTRVIEKLIVAVIFAVLAKFGFLSNEEAKAAATHEQVLGVQLDSAQRAAEGWREETKETIELGMKTGCDFE